MQRLIKNPIHFKCGSVLQANSKLNESLHAWDSETATAVFLAHIAKSNTSFNGRQLCIATAKSLIVSL